MIDCIVTASSIPGLSFTWQRPHSCREFHVGFPPVLRYSSGMTKAIIDTTLKMVQCLYELGVRDQIPRL